MMRPERAHLSPVGKHLCKRPVACKRACKPLSCGLCADNPHPQYVARAQKLFDRVFKMPGKLPRRRAKRLADVPCVKREARSGSGFSFGEPAMRTQGAQESRLPTLKCC